MGVITSEISSWLPNTTFPESNAPLRCGVSGGADSLALMALAVEAGCEVTAVHVDHGQRPESSQEAELVKRYASSIGASFESHSVDVQAGSNLEARMRAARYGVLGPNAATGHTADDQAETMLINLLRGSGLAGLGAMKPGHRRPILLLRRTNTEAICAALGWTPVYDSSNQNPAFQRNRIRHEVIPLLNEIASRDVVPLLSRTAGHARDGATILSEQAESIDPTKATELAVAPAPISALALQKWIREETMSEYPVDSASLERVLDVARGTTKAAEVNGGWRVSRSQQVLRVTPPANRESNSRPKTR